MMKSKVRLLRALHVEEMLIGQNLILRKTVSCAIKSIQIRLFEKISHQGQRSLVRHSYIIFVVMCS